MVIAAMHGDVASAIGQQVEQMILQAKKDSEARVRHDLSVARTQLQHMESQIDGLNERVARCARVGSAGAVDPSQTLDRAFLSQKISQLEQKWGSEVKALKQDMHRTILAHNHNSDLMRHHRDALDEAKKKLDAQTQPKAEQVDAQLDKVDRMLRAGQAKQRALDALTEQLATLEQQVGELLPNTGTGLPGSAFSPMPGILGQGGAGPWAEVQQREAATAAAVAKRGGKKDGEPPTDEEVRNRLLQRTRAAAAGSSAAAVPAVAAGMAPDAAGMTFNAEAPVFVPRSATSPSEGSDSGEKAPGKTDAIVGGFSDPAKGGDADIDGADETVSPAAEDDADGDKDGEYDAE